MEVDFKNLLIPFTNSEKDSHEVHLGEELTITVAEVHLAVKILETNKAAGCDRNAERLELRNSLANLCLKWLGVLKGQRKTGKLG